MEGISKLQSPLAAEIQDPKQEETPDDCSQDQERKSCQLNPCEDDVTDRTLKGLDSLQDRPEVQTKDRFPTETQQYSSGKSELSGSTEEKIQDSVDEALCLHQNRTHLDLKPALANQDGAEESGGSVPELVVTEADLCRGSAASQRAARPADLVIPAADCVSASSYSNDGGDVTCCELPSPRSDSFSVTSGPTISRRSEEDDSRSITASSVMSLFHRVQLDPLEKDWLRSSAVGDLGAQRLLLAQEAGLVLKKTALHWAAKQGRLEAVDMMLRSGADVNVRAGYTALHLASIHGREDIVQTLISKYNAKTTIRDYHGKTAVQYWGGCPDIFNKAEPQTGGRFGPSRRTQRFALPSLRLSRSRSQGQLQLGFGAVHQSASYEALDLHV